MRLKCVRASFEGVHRMNGLYELHAPPLLSLRRVLKQGEENRENELPELVEFLCSKKNIAHVSLKFFANSTGFGLRATEMSNQSGRKKKKKSSNYASMHRCPQYNNNLMEHIID